MKKKLLIAFILFYGIIDAQYTKLLDFSGASNGETPFGDLFYDGSSLYGMTQKGGANNKGVLFKIQPDGSGYTKLIDFAGVSNGAGPEGTLISDGTFLYGATRYGGANDKGILFKILPNGTGFTKIFEFAGTSTGDSPIAPLFYDGTFLYGTTLGGGTNAKGVIFKIKPDGTGFTKLLDFALVSNGQMPYGGLVSDGTFFYGTAGGGVNGFGVIYKIKPDGTAFAKLHEFSSDSNGWGSQSKLIFDGTFLYGLALFGGANDLGVIFKIKPDGTAYSKLLDFAGISNGSNPPGSLVFDGSALYGMTGTGGANDQGAVFKINPDGSGYTTLLDFDYIPQGGFPGGSLISNGNFLYGMTSLGGANIRGVIFKIEKPPVGISENIIDAGFKIFPNPSSSQITIETKNNFDDATLNIYNAFGQIVKLIKNISGQTITFSKNDLSNGIYILEIKQKDKIISGNKLLIAD